MMKRLLTIKKNKTMFKKLVVLEPLNLISSAEDELHDFAEKVETYYDVPSSKEEIVNRIGDADAVLISYTSTLCSEVLEQCLDLDYIGMCCSLYSPESANVDIHYANEHGITVNGIRDYGDEGVVEYVISELVRSLHGFGKTPDGNQEKPWDGVPREVTGIKVGVVGLGKSGGMVADALHFLGADITYFARSEKEDAKQKGYRFLPLKEVLSESEVVITCLNKHTVLLYEGEFEALGNKKMLFNTGLTPAWDEASFARWIDNKDNRLYCDTLGALGNERFLDCSNVRCTKVSVGRTRQAFDRLSEKVLANITNYVKNDTIPQNV